MKKKVTSRVLGIGLVSVCLLLAMLAYWQQMGTALTAASSVEQVWDNVRRSSGYSFSADVNIETIPLPTAGNIGRFSQTDSLYLEGTNDLANETLEMALWGGSVNVANRAAAYQMRVQDGNVQTRTGDGEWQSSVDSTVAFAPEGDFLAFLDMADNIAAAPDRVPASGDPACAALDCSRLAVYTFDLNSRAYADRLAHITEDQMVRTGQLPPGASVQIPQHLAETTGSGELWVDGRGLPIRQKVTLAIPAAAGADYRTETEMDIRFADYQGYPGQLAALPGWQRMTSQLARLDLPAPSEVGANIGLLSLVLLGMVFVARPGRRTRLVVTVMALVAIVFGQPLQTQAYSDAAARLEVRQAEQAATERARSLGDDVRDIQNALRAAPPYTPPVASIEPPAAPPALQSSTLDYDEDGLTDEVEKLIGTNPHAKDTDFDGITDFDEVTGFSYGGQTWYGNPLWADSNGDGVIDRLEWNPTAPDSDGDGTPDLYDFDDDGDGVPDDVDISRLVASKDDGGNLIAFSDASPLNLTLDGLQANRYTYVNLQLRPTNPNQLWYAFNVLNWPKDEKGNMQDWDSKTFFDLCVRSGESNCQMSPDANGDIKLVPMLEVAVPDLSNLPRTSGGALDTDLLSKYGISVQPAGNGSYYIYAPLTLVEDSSTGAKVAFSAYLLYQTGAAWQPQQMRLSWGVQVLNEQYADPDAAKKAIEAGSGFGENKSTMLHAYYSDFNLTGLNVREDRGVDMAIVYEDPVNDPDVTEDDALVQIMSGLDRSYMVNRDCDFLDNEGNCVGDGQRDITIPVIKQRWDRLSNNGTTSGQRWGIPANRLRVETYSFAHDDEATMLAGGQYAPAILNAHFTGTAATKPSLLFVRESRFRSYNVDVRATGESDVAWSGHNISMSMGDVPEIITGNYTLAPYQYVSATNSWTPQTPQEYVSDLEQRYPVTDVPGNTAPVVSVGEQTAVLIVNISAVQGKEAVLSQKGPDVPNYYYSTLFFGDLRMSGANISDESLRQLYTNAIANAGSAISAYLTIRNMVVSTGLTQEKWNKLSQKIIENNRERLGLDITTTQSDKPPVFSVDEDGIVEWADTTPTKPIDEYGGDNAPKVNPEEAAVTMEREISLRNAMTIAALGGLLTGIILTNLSSKGAQTAGEIMLASMSAVFGVIDAVTMYRSVSLALRTLPQIEGLKSLVPTIVSFRYSLSSAVAKSGAVGAVIGVGVTWVMFFAAWGKGRLSTDSVVFNSLVAGAVAGTLTAVLTFFVSLTVVGAIILAVVAVFDLIALIVCKAGVKAACSLGISEAITKLMTEWLYTGGVMIDTAADPSITNIDDAEVHLTHPERGQVVGNSVRFSLDLWTYVRHLAPEPGIIYHYSNFFTPEDLASTTVKYTLDTLEKKNKVDLNQTSWDGVVGYGWVVAEVPSPVVGWLVPTVKTKDLYQTARSDWLTSGLYEFTTARINQVFPLYLNTGLALPRYDCWFQVCKHKAAKSTVSTDLGKQFVLDILPAALDEFVTWTQLGTQIDPDGDSLGATVDPDQTKWDTDGDTVPDNIEYKYGIERGYGFNPLIADADADGLNDAAEMRYGTDPGKADTDGDGLTDFEEINGYTLTIKGLTVHAVSDPTLRDSDLDWMSDGLEKRLNTIDPVSYPFHPSVINQPPARIYSALDDTDRVLAIGQSMVVTTTVINGTTAENELLAVGSFGTTLPGELGSATQTKNFILLPRASTSMVLNGAAAAGQRYVDIDTTMSAGLVPVGSPPGTPPPDIIIDNPVPVTIDSDLPDVPALTQGAYVQPGRTVIIGGTASDPTSYVAGVEVSVSGGPFSPATGTGVWAFPVDIPNNPTGTLPVTVRAVDAVGNSATANFTLTIDSVLPDLTFDIGSGSLRHVQRNADGNWTLRLSGTVADSLAGVGGITVQVGTSANVDVPAADIQANGDWTFDYPFDDISFNADPSPTGPYTLTVTARDTALPDGNPNVQVVPFVIDMTPPTLAMLSHPDETQITDGAVFTGTVSDDHAAVVSVDYAFVDAATALETEKTLLDLPFNDLPETVLFRNNASEPTRIFCLDESCPTSGAPGNDGTAASFDGVDDLLRSFEVLDLPESGVTTALWFKTTCADCGLFSTIAGQFPTQTGHDRDLYLAAGKVCVDVQVGAGAETRCTVSDNNADGQWHQVVHSLGAGGNALYLDGALAVSSPTTASTFTAQDRVLAGYAAAAATPYLTGALDDVIIYEGQLSATSIAALYRRWQPAVLANGNSQWSFTVPEGLEGYYQIDMRATDSAGNRTESRGEWPQFRGPVDTGFPTFDLNVAYSGYGSAAQTTFSSFVRDANLTTDDYGFVCPLAGDQLRYETDPIQLQYTNQPDDKLTGIEAVCVESGFQNSQVSARACDLFGHCAAGSPPQTVAYIGTRYNTLTPAGSLPNAIERTVLSDPQHRVRIIERPGQIVTDIAVDTSRGKLYWGEMRRGDYAQPAQIMRANLDGSDPQVLVSGLTAYAPEALQIAIDPVGNKLYWIKGAELWWSNLDGTLPQVIYTIDRAVVGVSRLGDLVVDGENGRLYFAENRRHGTLADYNAAQAANVNYIPFHGRKHTLIVTTNLNGTAPEFFAGVGPGCTYANFYDNQGTGSGPGLQPTICLISGTDGFDVESMTFSNNTLYWTAFDAAGVNSAAYGRVPGSPAFTVAPLELTGNSQGLRTEPLPTMYVAPGSIGVYVAVGDQVVRGEPGGEFSLFSSFRDDSPPPATGVFIRKRSDLTAMAVVRTPQTVQTKADLAVDITSPDLVLLNGDTGRYDLQIANNSGLPADNTTLTLTLPDAGSFAGASQPCAAAGTTVTCDLGRLDPYGQQTLAISFIVSTVDVATLTATAVVSSAFADANAADNSASHTGITAAPTLAALPGGVPYIYASSADHFVRIPLIGDHTPEPVLLDNNGLGGNIIASDVAGGKLFISNVLWKIAAVNPNGTGYGVIGDANSNAMVTQDSRLSVAVDEVGGRVYWSDIVSLYLTKIQSANLDGSDVQTVVPQVVNQRGIVVDTVRRKLLWVGNDLTQSQNIIFRSNLDGSDVEIAYSAPAGRLINYLAIDPYAQKLYWIDSAYNGGALFWADSDGQNVAVLHEYLGANARGTVVVPQQNSIYFTSGNAIARSDLNGDNYEELAWLDGQRYTGVSNLDPTAFPWLFFNHPDSNLVLAFGAPFAPPACTGADGNEPNDSAAAATVVGTGTFTAALCRSTSADGPADQDVYRVTVPSGQQVEVTLDPPADYNLYLQLGDFTADVSTETGTTQDSVSAANYSGADQQYTVTVYAPSPTNSPALYTVGVALSAAPPQTVFTNDQCLAVDPLDVPAPTGNGSPATATPLTVGQAVTAALCYQDDIDYYSFNGTAGQTLSVDLPVRPADYGIYVYRPNGSLFNAYSATGVWTYGTPFTLDASGAWKVAVLDVNLTETLSQYQLLVSDLSCQLNDSYEPNNAASQAADISGQSRVFATLCSAADQDYYQFSATAGQQLTINYPADGAGGNLVLQNSAGAALGQVTPGTQGTFLLANAGTYRLLAASSTLSGSDVPYMFQWSLATPPAASTDTRYVYYADYPHFIRVALSNDHSVEGLLIDGGASSGALTASTALGKLFFVDSVSDSLVSLDFSGNNRTVIIPDANPDNVGVTAINVAVDDLGGRVYWIQPRGAAASTAADLKSATLNGGDVQTVAADVYNQRSLLIDPIKGLLYWVAGDEIRRSRLDGSNPELVRAAVPGEQVRDLALDPYAQKLYWLDPNQQTLWRANSDGSGSTALITGLGAGARGLVVRPLANELYYSSGTSMFRATLNGSGLASIASLSGTYQGPSNLDPNAFVGIPIGTPDSNLVLGQGSPLVSPCDLADIHEPNNDSGTATPLTVGFSLDVYGALCNTVSGQPTDVDYYRVTVPDRKTLDVTLSQLPADYRLVIIHPDGYAAAFSDTPGLVDEHGLVSNTSGADVDYTVVVLSGYPIQNSNQYKLTLVMGDVPPPPDPSDYDCGLVDVYDAPAPGGNGTLASATPLSFGVPMAAALCYGDDVDMYGFDGLAGQTIRLDLPTRPLDYDLTLYDPGGAPMVVISSTTSTAYGDSVTLPGSGRWTVAVSKQNLTPTTDQYQLLVTDDNCVAGDVHEPNNDPSLATALADGSRIRATLCSSSDVDLYAFTATAGQQVTLNYPANATGAALRLLDSGSGEVGVVNAGSQGQFTLSAGDYTLSLANNALTGQNVAYLFQMTLGAPTPPPAGSPFIYYSRTNDLIRAEISSGSVEPIMIQDIGIGGTTIAADTVRSKLYVLDYNQSIFRINFDGTNREVVVTTTHPPGSGIRYTESLAVDESTGRFYWAQADVGITSRIMSANGDGSDVQEVIPLVRFDHGIAVDSVAGLLYWAELDTYNGVELIRRSNLDGSDVQTVYVAPSGREIRDLTVDPFAAKLYWRDATQNLLLWMDTEGDANPAELTSVGSDARGFVVRPLLDELYFSDGSSLYQAARDGSNAVEIARLEGEYNGVSNLDPNVFYPTVITPPGSNLALGYGQLFSQACSAVDGYEPNNDSGSAAPIGVGTISAALCTPDLQHVDTQDFYQTTVDAGKQISVTLSDLPQNYGLSMWLNGQLVGSSYQPGLVDEMVAHVNSGSSPAVYLILVERLWDTTSSSLPYHLTVAVGDAPPPPPPPPPPPDLCAPVDPYDQPGILGNGSRSNATLISFNSPIVAALCYAADKDYYAFDGVIGQNVTLNLDPRPADYYVYLYNPDGQYFNGIFPGSQLTYGDSVTLNASGRWTVGIWYPYLTPTTDQYTLELGVNSACSGLDPYEPNNDQGNPYVLPGISQTVQAMLCETDDLDFFSFPVLTGQRVRITPRTLTPGMEMWRNPPGGGWYPDTSATEEVIVADGDYSLGFFSSEPEENLPYRVDIEILPAPTPTPLPNNWTCTTYPSSDVPQRIEDLATLGSVVSVPAAGVVTHVGLKDITFNHKALFDVSFGLSAPDGTVLDLFAFNDYGFYVWCGLDGQGNPANCQLSIDDGAVEGLRPPQFPNNSGTFRPSRSSFAPFNGKASNGDWTLLVNDSGLADPPDFPDTTGDLYGWSLEVCIDNGNPPTPSPTPTATPTAPPSPVNGTPIPTPVTLTPTPTPTAVPTVCTLAADSYEPDNTPAAASDFDLANLTSGSRTFSSLTDADWMRFTANAGRLYTFSADLVGWSGGVTLSIFDADGPTLKVVGQNQIAFTPTTGGQYFLRAQSSAGITIPCSASYSVGLVITNPNATPVPTPVGTPLPPGHDKPPLSAAVLAPADSAVVTQLQPINVDVGLNADNNIQSAAFLVDGVSVDSYSAPPDTGDATWATTWTPAQSGVYSLTAEITDSLNATAASSANVVYVDLAGPSVSIAAGDITLADLESDGTYLLQGTATDDSQVDTVEVRLDGGPWQEAQLDGTNWSFTLAPLAQASPDGGSLAIDARVTDVAAQTATDSATVVLDVVAPDIFTATTSLVSGAVITPGMVISDLNARLAWTAVPGAASVYAGWTSSSTPSLGALTAFPPSAGTLDQTILQGSTRYAHVVAVDSHGNQTAVTRGPFFFDSAETPDLITNLAVQDWVNSGGKQVGQMATDVHGVQKLFAGWNATTLRLRWQGLNVNSDGDLYLYLGTGGPGSTDLYNPYGPSEPAVLPFAADYLVRVSGGVTPTLLAYAGGAWVQQTEVAALSTGDLNDVLLPFADLGIAAPAAASLKLLGVASQQGALDVWATVPDRNLGRPWKQYAQFLSLGAGIVPADGVWADAPLEVVVSPDPSPAKPAGPGEVINVNVRATNGGSAPLPSLTVYGATTGGVTLTSPPQVATSIAPSTTASLDLSGVVASDGTLTVTLADSYHRTYRLETLAYTVDNTPPISVSLAVTYLVPLANTVLGTAVDDSPLDLFQMEVTSGAGTQVVSCDETGLTAGGYACLLDAGNAADGAIFTLRARATDIHGNISGWSTPVQVEVDATPPVLALSPPTLTAFSDGWINRREQVLTGALTDERGVARVVLCSQDQDVPCVVQRVLSDNSWAAPVPVVGDGIAVTLVFTGFDVAGNASTPLVDSAAAIPVIVDTVAPDLGPTTLTDGVSINNTPVQLGSGTVTDGGGVAGVQVYIVRPDGSSASVAGTVSGQDWWAHFVFDQAGDYQILVVATDIAGNKASQFAGLLTVTAVPTAVTLADFSAVQQGALVRLTWETSMELDNQGFNLYRGTSATGPDRQLNDVLIPSQSPGSSTGFVYIWDDGADLTPGTTYFYWVEDVDLSGTATRHSPVSVDYTTPTAVRLSGLAAAGAPRGGAPGVGVMLLVVMLAGAVALHRRRKLHPF